MLYRIARQFCRVAAARFVADVGAVRVNGAPGDEQLFSDLPACGARSNQSKDFLFPLRERLALAIGCLLLHLLTA